MDLFTTILFAFFGGIVPALVWLSFWLREDDAHPEPNNLLIKTFFYGMLAVPIALVFQFIINFIFIQGADIKYVFFTDYTVALITLTLWAAVEEVVKYGAAWYGGISKKDNNEPIDAAIYLITAAIGFAALENTMFLFSPLYLGDTTAAFITGNMRFIGATLLHVASSAIIGIFIAFSYYKNTELKQRYLITGLFLSITLHTIFNSFIIRSNKFTLVGFMLVWLVIVMLILVLEKIKNIVRRRRIK